MKQQHMIVSVAIEKWKNEVVKGHKNTKMASRYKGKSAMHIPLYFRNVMEIKSFNRTNQLQFIVRELEVRHVSASDISAMQRNKRVEELLQR